MVPAVTVDLIGATVELEQPIGGGMRTVGTGFLISDPTPDGKPRVVLVTANHVFARMKADEATIGYRVQSADGSWSFDPQPLEIRADGKPLWRSHPTRDVAAIAITAPPAFARAAIPLAWLGGADALAKDDLGPGDELLTLGFPQGLSANTAGFPILRAGRVASYPLGSATRDPTFLLDFRVFPGNSGGPVYLDRQANGDTAAATPPSEPVIAGILTQQVEANSQNLGIGIVTQAEFVRETVAMLDTAATAVSDRPARIVETATIPERTAHSVESHTLTAGAVALQR